MPFCSILCKVSEKHSILIISIGWPYFIMIPGISNTVLEYSKKTLQQRKCFLDDGKSII